ncbi:helix-turn-helix transcriptional regulator [Actinomyces faecalis]|nr:helix-turn-helix transcriptional regulator [Actinomyces faecalis]
MFSNNITRAELARRIGVAPPTVSMKLRGQIGWSLEDIFDTADALNLDVQDIMPSRDADGRWTPAQYVPGQQKAPAPVGAGAPSLVAGTGFEPATSGL